MIRERQMEPMTKKECRLLRLDTLTDPRGSLTAIEGGESVPFEINRVFFLHGLTPEQTRGSHAVRNEQAVVAVQGACSVYTHDGRRENTFVLDKPMAALYIPAMVWREIRPLSEDCLLAVLSDRHYDPDAYVRDFPAFLRLFAEGPDD